MTKERKQKTVIIADSHAKLASFIHWLADHLTVEHKTVRFSNSNNAGAHSVDYVDYRNADLSHRVIGIDRDSLQEPVIYLLVKDVTRIVFFVSHKRDVNEPTLAHAVSVSGKLLNERPCVHCLFGLDTYNQREPMQSCLAEFGIKAIEATNINLGDFKLVWETLLSTQSVVRSQPLTKNSSSASDLTPHLNPRLAVTTTVPLAAKAVLDAVSQNSKLGEYEMANVTETLNEMMQIDGAVGALIADYTSGMLLAKAGGGVNLDVAAAGNTEVIKAKMKTMAALGIKDSIEDILITLGTQYHILRPLSVKPGLFLYIVLDKAKSNLAMARFKLLDVEKSMKI